jgi:hypothetical protein
MASCSNPGNQTLTQSRTFGGWSTNVDALDASCPHGALNGSGHATLLRACIGLPDGGAQLAIKVEAKALAGYMYNGSCDGGNYCGASAASGGSASTSFWVTPSQVNKYCVGVVSAAGAAWGTAGYPGSHWFNPGAVSLSAVQFTNASGQFLALTPGATYLLNVQGTWRIFIPEHTSIYSNMAENSGTYDVAQNLVLQFAPANADHTCPRPQLSPAATSRVVNLNMPTTRAELDPKSLTNPGR